MEGFNVKNIIRFKNDIYAGVLGKIIGVYLGRPVEGWTYEAIRDTFGEINYYKNHRTGAPLIVPDDDISGTFAFSAAWRTTNSIRGSGRSRSGTAGLTISLKMRPSSGGAAFHGARSIPHISV